MFTNSPPPPTSSSSSFSQAFSPPAPTLISQSLSLRLYSSRESFSTFDEKCHGPLTCKRERFLKRAVKTGRSSVVDGKVDACRSFCDQWSNKYYRGDIGRGGGLCRSMVKNAGVVCVL